MNEILFRLAVYVGIGILCWAIAARAPMPQYRQSSVTRTDVISLCLGMSLAVAYDLLISPYVVAGLDLSWLAVQPVREHFQRSPLLVQVLCYVVVGDFLAYWAHRTLHSAGLWRFHAFHHAPKHLNWLAGLRGTPLHFIFTLTPGTIAASLFLFTDNPGVLLALLLTDAINQQLIHSNVVVPYARQIEYFLVTPRMHFVHHHPEPRYTNSNYGFLFSTWDHLFDTYVDADAVATPGLLGIDYELDEVSLFLGLNPAPARLHEQRQPPR